MDTSITFLKAELQKRGIRPSYQRIKVLEFLYNKKEHPTVEDIFHDLSYQIPSLSKTTIYNTVHTFVETGLVRLISIDGFDARIDLTTENHGHFKCDRCGSIFNFAINIDSVPVDELRHFQIKAKNVYFNGICPNCLNKIKDRED